MSDSRAVPAPSSAERAAPPLNVLLLATAHAVQAVAEGYSLTEVLNAEPLPRRAAVQSLSFYVMRRLARGRALADLLLERGAPNPLMGSLLLTVLCLLSVEPAESADGQRPPRYEAHTLVSQAVTAAGQDKQTAAFKGLINACLRRYLREREALMAQAYLRSDVRWGFPKWWIRRIREAYPSQWESILASAAAPGPLTLRINTRKTDRDTVMQALQAQHIGATPIGQHGIVLDQAQPVGKIPGFEQGWWLVQDAGAQCAADLLPLTDGMRVLDACAAPGGKTAGLLMQAKVHLTALDIDEVRLSRVTENLLRLGLDHDGVILKTGNAARLPSWWDGQPFDAILADVPCTASGIVRRHPDIKWLREEQDIADTAALQRRIVAALWETLKPGGLFLYVTCSVFPQEGIEQEAWMRTTLPGAVSLPAPGQLLPGQGSEHDGFFYALLRKQDEKQTPDTSA
ncbi:16S rRNA (cytosine(967)-C(5))-methyltransferase RsmB [Advenella kashmirensis]|uniref:16S rRNA (cytosine(967)-C(5))-methyltransferase RsmB n=1 Tax=Advenella kashmirensis TaxID=310575 RepID=UPI0004CE77DE|nr:16S rRNA (cytosine(967)-C(5))-methyltransferase RsmB [Advenella kashmirensis]